MSNPYGITKENLLQTLPSALQHSEKLSAIANSVADVLAARPKEMQSILIYPNISQLPEGLLDILAYDFKVDWYDYDADVETKRNLIQTSFRVHQITGTKQGLVDALTSVCTETSVKEWFEYSGDPGYFRIIVHDAREFYLNSEAFLAAITRAKRLSAHMDKLTAESNVNAKVSVGIASKTRYQYTIYMEQVSLDNINCLVDQDGVMLADENGNLLTV